MSDEPSPPKDFSPALEVLIAQLHLIGVLEGSDIANMARRLRECGRDDLANAIFGIVIANAVDVPEVRRSMMQAVPDGGNDES